MIGIDLFAGAGGMSLGAVQAGIDVRLAVEADPHAAATYAVNFPRTTVISDDIASVKQIDVQTGKRPTVLFGGPPCQGFSTSNQRTRSVENKGNWLFREFLRITKLWNPAWVVFENVKGILETESGVFFHKATEGLKALGYTMSCAVLNAADFGAPQRRQRVFAVGSRNGTTVVLPKPNGTRPVTVRQAISDLPELPNGASFGELPYRPGSLSKYARTMRGKLKKTCGHLVTRNALHIVKRYKYVPQGGNWENIPARLMDNYADRSRCHTGIYHRLCEDAPSIVIGNYRKNMLIHPTQDRGLSVREAARIQSFPDWYEFHGSIGFQQQQVGNAVPPRLAYAVFSRLVRIGAGEF